MSSLSARSSHAWTVIAHVVAAAVLGGLEAWRLAEPRIALALVPVFAATGLAAGVAIAATEWATARRPRWLAAFVVALPSLAVTIPISATTFDGAYAQSLAFAGALPYVAPIVAWLAIGAAVWIGRRLIAGGRSVATRAGGGTVERAIVIVAVAGLIGAVVWAERHVLGTGYPDAQIGGSLAVIVLGGILVRVARRVEPSPYLAALVAAIAIGTAVAAATTGLERSDDRRLLANHGDHGRDLVRMWRRLIDLDGDGSSSLLGGGDCDDLDPRVHPGAIDPPSDGIDQDCDGFDAVPAAPPPVAEPRAAAAWRDRPEVRAVLERTPAMNVLVISIDALRFDLLAPDAPHRADFPRLAKLLDRSVQFTRAIAPAAGTDVALSTLVTGRFDPFQEIAITLPEAMRSAGRRTASALPREVTRHVGEVLLERGFDAPRPIYTDWDREDVGDHVSAPATTFEGVRSIERAGNQPWFQWVHYFDVHEHHQIAVPEELKRQVHDGGSDRVHRYRALLLAIDRSVGKLLDELVARGIANETIVVLLSDHGESLHGDPRMPATHGQVAYGPLIRIPIAFAIPGVAPGVRTDPVSLVDVAPTVLALAGHPGAMGPLDGYDLVPAILGGPAAQRPPANRAIVVHEELQWSVVEWPYQVVVRPGDDLVELYDLERDPANVDDLSGKLPDVTRRLRARYGEVPEILVDRTVDGRAWREQRARPPQRHARPAGAGVTSTR